MRVIFAGIIGTMLFVAISIVSNTGVTKTWHIVARGHNATIGLSAGTLGVLNLAWKPQTRKCAFDDSIVWPGQVFWRVPLDICCLLPGSCGKTRKTAFCHKRESNPTVAKSTTATLPKLFVWNACCCPYFWPRGLKQTSLVESPGVERPPRYPCWMAAAWTLTNAPNFRRKVPYYWHLWSKSTGPDVNNQEPHEMFLSLNTWLKIKTWSRCSGGKTSRQNHSRKFVHLSIGVRYKSGKRVFPVNKQNYVWLICTRVE